MSDFAADLVLFLHFAFVAFVVGGLVTVWLGAAVRWKFVRSFGFRAAHLAAIFFVAAEAVGGVVCPLTLWEDALRGTPTATSFVARWMHRLMFYNLPEWVFTLTYLVFAGLVALTFWLLPPHRHPRHDHLPAGRPDTPQRDRRKPHD